MDTYISIENFANRYEIMPETVLKRHEEIPGLRKNGEVYEVIDSARYPVDKRWLKGKTSGEKRYELLKSISNYRYIDHNLLKVSKASFDLLIKQLRDVHLIEENGSGNIDGANAYDCTSEGDELLKQSKRKVIIFIAELVGRCLGEMTEAILT